MYHQNGIKIGRTTSEQWTSDKGKKVQKTELKEGDAVFFKDTYNSGYKDGVSHVGIYLGNGKFIHNSSGAGKVTISDLNSSYYSAHYLGAKRFTEDEKKTSSPLDPFIPPGVSDSANGEVTGVVNEKVSWWGELLIVILTILLVVVAIVFFLKAFGVKNPIQKKIKGGKKK